MKRGSRDVWHDCLDFHMTTLCNGLYGFALWQRGWDLAFWRTAAMLYD